ncbi:MAG: hypothetical protein ACRC8A_13105 [Microcoleaceae cyanobacterium]
MDSSASVPRFWLSTVLGGLFIALGSSFPIAVQAQEIPQPVDPATLDGSDPLAPGSSPQEGVQPVLPGELRPLGLDSSFLSIQGGNRLVEEASSAVATENYTEAATKLQEARQVFNQLSNFYQQLASSFSGVDNRIADQHRDQARESAQMRDTATYQLALVHRAQNKPELAVPLLIQVIRSQAPTRDLGQKAYQQLMELGFVTDSFPRNTPDGQSTSSTQPTQ